MNLLKKINIKGYKSIKESEVEFGGINIFIGGNGAGKSNLISFFEMVQKIRQKELQNFVAEQGGANLLLHNGRKATDSISFDIYRGDLMFYGRLKGKASDNLYFAQQGLYNCHLQHNIYAAEGQNELADVMDTDVYKVLDDIGVYHFHDTSKSSPLKTACRLNDNVELASDGRNVPAILYRIKENNPEVYQRIVSEIRMAAPYFQDFLLRPNPLNLKMIDLEWYKYGCEVPFGAEQLSDGTLRFICLVLLLCLPEEMQKDIIVIDEPELGLHPFAVTIVTELMKKYAHHGQVIAATQSVDFINEFEPEDVVVAENKEGDSTFIRPNKEKLSDWLEDYSLGELWKKNVIGGRP